MTAMDIYYPFATGVGATASQGGWLNIASSFREGGILRGKGNALRPSISGTTVTLQTGAVLIQGFYGESTGTKTFTVPTSGGSFGIVVAQADFTSNVISLVYNASTSTPVQTTSLWEYMVCRILAGVLTDCRAFIAPLDMYGQSIIHS